MSTMQCCNGQKLRRDMCCWTTECQGEGFKPCIVQNGTDVCEPCLNGQLSIKDPYQTKWFVRSPCVNIHKHQSEFPVFSAVCNVGLIILIINIAIFLCWRRRKQCRNKRTKGTYICEREEGQEEGEEEEEEADLLTRSRDQQIPADRTLAVDNGVVLDVEESVEQQTSTNAERGTVLSTRMSGVRYKHEGDKIVRKVNRHNIDKNQSLFKQPRALTIPFTDAEDDDNNENEEPLVAETDYKEQEFDYAGSNYLSDMTHEDEKDIDKKEIEFRAGYENLPISDIIEVPFERDTDLKVQTDRRSYLIPGPFIEHDEPFSKGNRPLAVVIPRTRRVTEVLRSTKYMVDYTEYSRKGRDISNPSETNYTKGSYVYCEVDQNSGARNGNPGYPLKEDTSENMGFAQCNDLPHQMSLPLLTDQAFNVEPNRVHLVTGLNSYSLEEQNGEMNLVLDSTVPGGVQVFESLSSGSYEPIRPSDTTNSM